jgi:hypothetical protein
MDSSLVMRNLGKAALAWAALVENAGCEVPDPELI